MHLDQIAPGSVQFEDWEQERMAVARIAERLHKFPHEVRAARYTDLLDLLDLWAADEKTQETRTRMKQ